MIRVEAIRIREFRGIRHLTLEFGNGNFAICGPNGTGKSGVVDALEFGLTGEISRLSGAGTAGLSVRAHGPHVDSREKPEAACVTLTVSIPALGKTATIERTVKDARNPTIAPDDKDVRAAIESVMLHPEFALTRRELIRYVLAEPGKRAKEVQALLRLDELEAVRTTLQKIANATDKTAKSLLAVQREASSHLARALDITQLVPAKLLEAANARRAILGLPPLTTLEANTSIRDGLMTAAGTMAPTRIAKTQALADLIALHDTLKSVTGGRFRASCQAAAEAVAELGKDEASLNAVMRQDLLKSALELFDDHTCPVCGTEWKPEEFRAVIDAKLKHFGEVAARRAAVEALLRPLGMQLSHLSSTLALVAKYGSSLNPAIEVTSLNEYSEALTHGRSQFGKLLPLASTGAVLSSAGAVPENVLSVVQALEKAIGDLPEPSQQDAARDFLTVGQERLEAFRQASLKLRVAREQAATAATAFDVYNIVTTEALEAIYKKVEKTFSDLYRIINHDDENTFEAELRPSTGKLGFDVDFYGRGKFPPGAYHSEGHQDGMGLCLYLALMKHLLGDRFTFAVLDDVLMSVDTGHRREVSKLLRQQFPNTQFVITTHDEIWLRHMQTEGLIPTKAFAHFRTWNVETGPTEWSDRDVWQEIDDHLMRNEVPQAAALLRRYLEHLSRELCHRLRAHVEFRGDAQFMLSDLLPPATGALRKLLKRGKAVAQSWGRKDEFEKLHEYETVFSEAATKSNIEQWQINTAVHYNEWANLQKSDFEPVVAAFRTLTDKFRCESCDGLLYVVPERGSQELLRCGCNSVNINLMTKN